MEIIAQLTYATLSGGLLFTRDFWGVHILNWYLVNFHNMTHLLHMSNPQSSADMSFKSHYTVP